MNTALSSFPNLRPTIKILVVYELEINRQRAESMQLEFSRRMEKSFTFSVSWWRLDSLRRSETRKAAANFVATADVICFSLLSGRELSQSVTGWIEKILLGGNSHKPALFTLVESGGIRVPQLSRAEVYLSRLSAVAGVDCLCYSDSIPITRTTRRTKQDSALRKNARLAMTGPHADSQNNAEFPVVAFPAWFRHQLPQSVTQ